VTEKNKKVAPQEGLLSKLLAGLPEMEQGKLWDQIYEYRAAKDREKAEQSFMAYVNMMWP
jgi:hypothetical protein